LYLLLVMPHCKALYVCRSENITLFALRNVTIATCGQ
jgi:hypothetical protein